MAHPYIFSFVQGKSSNIPACGFTRQVLQNLLVCDMPFSRLPQVLTLDSSVSALFLAANSCRPCRILEIFVTTFVTRPPVRQCRAW